MNILKKLVIFYESITTEQIESKGDFGPNTAEILTGYECQNKCIVCLDVKKVCADCAYIIMSGRLCCTGENEYTYKAIGLAKNAEELKTAYRNRAKHIRGILK